MMLLKAVCPAAVADDVIEVLRETPGTGRIIRSRGTEVDGGLDVIETEIPNTTVDRLIARLAALDGWNAGDVTLTTVGEGERFQFVDGQAITIGDSEGGPGSQQVRMMLRHLVRVDYQYVLLMMMAALIATVGLIAGLPIAIIGAMAFSPDLGRLNAMGFAILIRDLRLLMRGSRSLAVGMVIAITLAAAGTILLKAVDATHSPLSDIPPRLQDFVSVLDGFTITVAIAAGIAAMVVFMAERGNAAVGVGVSITTIPAAAYIGIAIAERAWSEAGNAATVLIVNIACVVGAEVLTGLVLRKYLKLRVVNL
jgi:uncharacterized hydrophobic protein (TIGR00271 family)